MLPGRADLPVTEKQEELIQQLLDDFPQSRELHEYADYAAHPTQGNASALITRAIEDASDKLIGREKYLSYIAQRPRVQKLGTHGLFTSAEEQPSLAQMAKEIAEHPGNVWLPIFSMRREDAARLGYDSAKSWQALLSAHAPEIAGAMKIPLDQFRWCAAFHDEAGHPHVHMVCWSADAHSGFLAKSGIEQIKSKLAADIFRAELTEIYTKKTELRDAVSKDMREELKERIAQMQTDILENDRIAQLLTELADKLETVHGKKQYGYLKAPLKSLVDQIVDELAGEDCVAKIYALWYEQRENVLRIYKSNMPERLPLSQQKEFKAVKNMVIREAEALRLELAAAQAEGTTTPDSISARQDTAPYTDKTQTALMAATRLMHNLAGVFRDNSAPFVNPVGLRIDSKRRKKLLQKRLAMGHKADDHEDASMQGQKL